MIEMSQELICFYSDFEFCFACATFFCQNIVFQVLTCLTSFKHGHIWPAFTRNIYFTFTINEVFRLILIASMYSNAPVPPSMPNVQLFCCRNKSLLFFIIKFNNEIINALLSWCFPCKPFKSLRCDKNFKRNVHVFYSKFASFAE